MNRGEMGRQRNRKAWNGLKPTLDHENQFAYCLAKKKNKTSDPDESMQQ